MNCDNASLLLYAVTDRSWLHGQTLYEQAEQALQGGATFLQLREKELDEAHFKEEAIALKALCKQYGVPFVLDDNVALAVATDADGVHVGQSDMAAGKVRALIGPDKILGVSAQTVEEALLAEREGADYLGVCGSVHPGHRHRRHHEGQCRPAFRQRHCRRRRRECDLRAAGHSHRHARAQSRRAHGAGSVIPCARAQTNIQTAADWGHHFPSLNKIDAEKETEYENSINDRRKRFQRRRRYSGRSESHDHEWRICHAFLGQQIDSVFTDIRPDAVKIGMVASSGLIEVIAERLQHYAAQNIVVDPVMVATSGARLISEDAIATLEARLLPLATVLTPNIPEAEVLSGLTIASPDDMIAAGKAISERYGCAVLCKGGHRLNDANDLLYRDGGYEWFNGKRIDNPNTHGTGCTLSSAIAANLAKGFDLDTAVRRAKDYLSGALAAMLDLGAGSGPMDHAFDLKPEYRQEA